ncbi:hypothetical protein MKW98_018233 [Papaver atlanticum]|uniref:Uncharacterized protein n=1 Tax=Papaver atlanticum TaxID=357466 RepID=A0AAD4S4B2_9MAGN|nr:hypothetical protein MKW98_018233 [Papaver atlanticum]
MASAACVNNVGMLPEGFLDCSTSSSYNPSSSYGWFSPRISFSRDFVEEESKKAAASSSSSGSKQKMVNLTVQEGSDDDEEDLEVVVVGSVKKELFQKVVVGSNNKDFGFGDFEFRLEEDPVKMLDADELFSDGKLVPRQLNTVRPVMESTVSSEEDEIRGVIDSVPETAKAFRRIDISDAELYLFSPKAPRCSSRWKELLGLKRNNNSPNPKNHDQNQNQKISSSSSSSLKSGALKHFLHRNNPKSLSQSLDSSLNIPLLRDSDSAEIVLPNSLSSSSSSSASSSSNQDEHPPHPRFSLDSDPKHMSHISLNRNPPRVRLSKSRPPTGSSTSAEIHQHHTSVRARSSMHRVSSSDQSSNQSIGLTIDSPRMNSSGKIVFQSLERSSSSPSTFNGGPRVKHRGVERSYSANVRVTPVLNVPVCSLRGSSKSGGSVFGFFSTTNTSTTSTPQKRADNNGSSSLRNHHHHHHTSRNRSSTSTATATTTTTATTNSITDRN